MRQYTQVSHRPMSIKGHTD